MFDKRNYLETQRDWIRQMILTEPRGAVARNANIILPSNHPDADAGYVIMEAIEYPVMSGSNTICVATVLLETGMLEMTEPVTNLVLESAAGLIPVECSVRDGKVTSVRFTNQPAFVYELDAKVEVEGVGTVSMDVAWGGMAYVIMDAKSLGFAIRPDEARDIFALWDFIDATCGAAGDFGCAPLIADLQPCCAPKPKSAARQRARAASSPSCSAESVSAEGCVLSVMARPRCPRDLRAPPAAASARARVAT